MCGLVVESGSPDSGDTLDGDIGKIEHSILTQRIYEVKAWRKGWNDRHRFIHGRCARTKYGDDIWTKRIRRTCLVVEGWSPGPRNAIDTGCWKNKRQNP